MAKQNGSDKNNKLALLESYAITRIEPKALTEIIRDNVGPGGISQFDLDRIKVPSSGATTWMIPSLDGEETSKEIVGVIVAWRDVRAYWETPFAEAGGGAPPDCSSDDAIKGFGSPGGACADCPLSQFGSDDRQIGQACKAMRLLFILRSNDILPIALAAPPTSLRGLRQYFLRLASKEIHYNAVVTKLSLEKATSKGNINYAKIAPTMAGELTPEETERIRQYTGMLTPQLERVQATSDDFDAE